MDEPSRDQAIETLRIVAAFAIVAFHAQLGDYRWWHSGLVVFVFLAAMFAAQPREEPRAVLPVLRRLMVPFVFWYLVYLAVNAVMGRPLLLDNNVVTALLAGPSWHLWFLPFAALVVISIGLLLRLPQAAKAWVVPACLVSGYAALFFADSWFPRFWDLPVPMTQWGHAVPAALIGIGIGQFGREKQMFWSVLAICMWPALIARQFGISSIVLAYYAGFLSISAAIFLSHFWPPNWRVQPIADCMFGVYLTHIITLGIAARLVGRENWAQVLIAFVLSLAGVYCARRFLPVTKAVLG